MTDTDRPAKVARVQAILDEQSADAVLLVRPESVSWILNGARVTVPTGGPAVLAVEVTRAGDITVVVPDNEAERLVAEELEAGLHVVTIPWFGQLRQARAGVIAEAEVVAQMRAARASLLPGERSRYRELGLDVASATTAVLSSAQPTGSERSLAARLCAAIIERGAEPLVILVAGASRIHLQHPLPSDAPIGDRAMVAVGARRHGLVANLTRWATWNGAQHNVEQLLEVEADAYAATHVGRSLNEVLASIAAAYETRGYPHDSWLRHHQGGPTGYLGRDPKVTPETTDVVRAGQAFAWNPWVPGNKVEDTVVVDEHALEVLTADPHWPTVNVRGVARPIALAID